MSVGGIVVSIAASQAVDPGSIPGRRRAFFVKFDKSVNCHFVIAKNRFRDVRCLRDALHDTDVAIMGSIPGRL